MGGCQCQCKDWRHESAVAVDLSTQEDQVRESTQVASVASHEEEICSKRSLVETYPALEQHDDNVTTDLEGEDDLDLLDPKASIEFVQTSRISIGVIKEDVVLYDSQTSPFDSQAPFKQLDDGWTNSSSIMDIVTSISAGEFLRSMSPPAVPDPDYKPAGMRPLKTSSNHNRPCDYKWLQDVLVKLSKNETASLGCGDADTSESLLPLFFVMGACPNVLCGMQVVMYCRSAKGLVDFWWVKPTKEKAACGDGGFAAVERETLQRHGKGPYKNDPGRSVAFYKPLAVLFENASVTSGWRFGIEEVHCELDGRKVPRAYMQLVSPEVGEDDKKMYVYLFWQEEWTMNPFARNKHIKGKMVYQKRLTDNPPLFFSRQYEIVNDNFSIQNFEEPPFSSYLPPETLKTLWEPDIYASNSSTKSGLRAVWK